MDVFSDNPDAKVRDGVDLVFAGELHRIPTSSPTPIGEVVLPTGSEIKNPNGVILCQPRVKQFVTLGSSPDKTNVSVHDDGVWLTFFGEQRTNSYAEPPKKLCLTP